jgi:hypothetical protein
MDVDRLRSISGRVSQVAQELIKEAETSGSQNSSLVKQYVILKIVYLMVSVLENML